MSKQRHMPVNQLAYSTATENLYWFDARGHKHLVPKANFIQMVMLWVGNGQTPAPGEGMARLLVDADSNPMWRMELRNLRKPEEKPNEQKDANG